MIELRFIGRKWGGVRFRQEKEWHDLQPHIPWIFEGGDRIEKNNKDQGNEYQSISLILQAARLLVELLS